MTIIVTLPRQRRGLYRCAIAGQDSSEVGEHCIVSLECFRTRSVTGGVDVATADGLTVKRAGLADELIASFEELGEEVRP